MTQLDTPPDHLTENSIVSGNTAYGETGMGKGELRR